MGQAKNVLWIMADQLRWDYLSCFGARHIETPNLDALAQQGVRFNRAYVQSPICGPSRMSFYTGRYVAAGASSSDGEAKKTLAFLCVGGEGPSLDASADCARYRAAQYLAISLSALMEYSLSVRAILCACASSIASRAAFDSQVAIANSLSGSPIFRCNRVPWAPGAR